MKRAKIIAREYSNYLVNCLSTKKTIELDLIEEYVYRGESRFRFKVRGTNLIVNVRAGDVNEAIEKAIEVLKRVGYISS